MSDALYELLRQSTAKVCTSKGEATGTATFIHPGHLLTAAHVIHGAGADPVVELSDGRQFKHIRVMAMAPKEKIPGQNWPLPDLAVFRVDDEDLPEHMCVELTDARPEGEEFCVDGFVRGLSDEVVQDRVTLSFDASREEGGATILQFTGNIQSGLSGAPVLDLKTGRVVGIVKADRDWRLSAGGFAVAGATIRESLPGHWASNAGLHRKSSKWGRAARTGRVPTVDREEIGLYLTATRDTLSQSPLLPPEVSRSDLRQPVRLRSKRLEKNDSDRSEDVTINEAPSLSGLSTAFIWDPLRCPWSDVAVVAGPGMGKSWLLAYHVSAIASHQLDQIASQPELRDEVEIPVWVAAAGLARQLPASPTGDQAMEALATAVHLNTGVLSPAEIEALMSSAAERENLILCVDGLDEVPSDLRSRLSTAIGLLEPKVRQLIVTTREAAGQLLADLFPKDFEEFSIEGFSEGDARRFIESWHKHNPGAAASVRGAIRESHHLKPLTRVPLLLGFVCRLVGSGEDEALPDTRSRLYHEVALDLLSGRWRDSEGRRAEGEISDPLLRLRLLSRAVGSLVTGWRTRPEEFIWSDIDTKLREDPDYETVRRGAIDRWDSRQRTKALDRDPDDPPDDVVLWEFEHDGLLVRVISRDRRPAVRFTHLVFAELCIALSLAASSPEERLRRLAVHRWFDDEWNDIVPIACGVADDPKVLMEEIGQVESDPWMAQALLQARSMAEAPDAVTPELVEGLVERVVEAMNGNLRADLGRCLKALEVVVSSDVGDARERVRTMVESARIRREEDAIALAVMLCRVGDHYGEDRCVAMAEDGELPGAVRTQARIALCETNDRDLVRKAVASVGDLPDETRESLVSSLVHGDAASVEVALEIARNDKLDLNLRASVAVGLIYAGAEEAAEVLLGDPRSSRTMRARAVTALLRTGQPVPTGEAETLAADPNVVPDDRLELIHALVLRGDRTVLEAGAELAVDLRLDYMRRRDLAQTILAIGALGRSVLAKEAFADWRAAGSRVRALLAMIERRDSEAAEVASAIVDDRTEQAWVRCAIATALLEWMPNRVDHETLGELIDLPELAEPELCETWERILIQMLASEVPSLVSEAEVRIHRVVGVAGSSTEADDDALRIPPNAQAGRLCIRLSKGGRKGLALLATIIGSAEVELDTRIQAAQVLAQSSNSAAETLEGLLDDESVPNAVRERLVVLFAMLGATVTFDRLLALLPGSEPAYSALYLLLSAADTTQEQVRRGVEAGSEAKTALSDASLPEWTLDFDELADEVPFEAHSETERKLRRQWIVDTLRGRLYPRLLSLLLPIELKELHRVGNFIDNDATRNWLATHIPSYREIAAAEVDRLKQELADDPDLLPTPMARADALGMVEVTSKVLREWLGGNVAGEWEKGFQLLLANEELFRSDIALGVFATALRIDSGWPTMQAHGYMLDAVRAEPASALVKSIRAESPLLDRLKGMVDSGRGADAVACAGIGRLRWPESAAISFYAAVGAELAEDPELAEDLMKKSAARATVKQATEGRKSLLAWEKQHNLSAERIEKLRDILGETLRRGEDPEEEGGSEDEDQIVMGGASERPEETGSADEDPSAAT